MDLKENRQCKSRDGFCFHRPWFCCLLLPLWISCLRWHAYVLGFFQSVLHESTIYLEDKVCIHFCYSLCTQFLPPFYFSTGHSYPTPEAWLRPGRDHTGQCQEWWSKSGYGHRPPDTAGTASSPSQQNETRQQPCCCQKEDGNHYQWVVGGVALKVSLRHDFQ